MEPWHGPQRPTPSVLTFGCLCLRAMVAAPAGPGPPWAAGHLTPTLQPSASTRLPATSVARGQRLGSGPPSPRSLQPRSQQEPAAPIIKTRAGTAHVTGTRTSSFPARPQAGSRQPGVSLSPTPRLTSPTHPLSPEPRISHDPTRASPDPQLASEPTTANWGHSQCHPQP